MKIGIIGDFIEQSPSQKRTIEALQHWIDYQTVEVELTWISTTKVDIEKPELILGIYDGIWAGPGDYHRSKGAFAAIHYCRTQEIPFLGT